MVLMSLGDLRLMALATLNEELDRTTATPGAKPEAAAASGFHRRLLAKEAELRKRLTRAGRLRGSRP